MDLKAGSFWELGSLSMGDVDAVRLILRGGSVIDWHGLNLKSIEDAHRFLKVNGYLVEDEDDRERLRHLFLASLEYLKDNLDFRFSEQVNRIEDISELLMMSATPGDFRNLACIVLKVMHIIHHVEAQELRHRLPVSDDQLFRRAINMVEGTIKDLRDQGAPISQYMASRKSRDSIISKLLTKKSSTAAPVLDRLRFRIITRTERDILPVLVYLKDHLFPYNYVVPGESRNEIVPTSAFVDGLDMPEGEVFRHRYRIQFEDAIFNNDWNMFSAIGFRMINFVVDMPIGVRDLVSRGDQSLQFLGAIVMLPVEFQVFDEATWESNEVGEASHDRYKDRQRWEVIRRLVYGGRFGMPVDNGFPGKTRV